MPAAERENMRRDLGTEVTDQRCGNNNGWKRRVQREDRDEGSCRDRPHPGVVERPTAHAVGGVQHQRRHRWLDAGRAAEADETELQPEAQRLGETHP